MMKILSWNIRGLGHPSKVAVLRDLIIYEKPRIIMLQETKQYHKEMNKVIEQQRQYRGSISEARGASGGIETIRNLAKCGISGTYVNSDKTSLLSHN